MGDTGIGLLERCVVLRERCGGDERVVVLERRAAGLLVYCGTRGEQTSEAFGSAWRVSCVRLGEEREVGLVCALHAESSAGLADAIRSYFSQSDTELSDLLDLMDGAGIPYAYACADEGGIVCREEAGAIAS
ncbi:hypothetical protein [Parolsenella catena]|uniref:hypothetical protein n=1 Tax=Parolsenella catena TaxID=2003188 RepID=UPI002FDE6B8B